MLAMFCIMLFVLALIGRGFAATALLYDDINCPSNKLNSKCVNLVENSCCISGFGTYFQSVIVTDIDQNLDYSVASGDENGKCEAIDVRLGTLCMQTYLDNILGASWFRPTHRTRAVVPTTCKAAQHADVYYISKAGEQRMPYSIMLAKEFDRAGAVNWSTHTFNADKLDVVQGVIAQHALNDPHQA